MTRHASPYAGLTLTEAIEAIIEDCKAEEAAEAEAREAEAAAWYGEE